MSAKITAIGPVAPANREPSATSGRCIAIVDDEDSVSRAFARLLRAYSFQTRIYGSGTEFLRSVSSDAPDCLIVDVHLGDMNGFEVLRRLSSMRINIPAIVVTARDEPGVRREFALCCATALLIKPIEGNSLLNAIGTAISTLDERGAEGCGL